MIERIMHCEKYLKTAHYVSELLAPHGKTLANDLNVNTNGLRKPVKASTDGFDYRNGKKTFVLKVIRWWSYHFYWCMQNGKTCCVHQILFWTSKYPTSGNESFDKTRVLVYKSALLTLFRFYNNGKPDQRLKDGEWLQIPNDNVVQRNLPAVITVPKQGDFEPIVYRLPVKLKYNTVKQKPLWVEIQRKFGDCSRWTTLHVVANVKHGNSTNEEIVLEIDNMEKVANMFPFVDIENAFETIMPSATGTLLICPL